MWIGSPRENLSSHITNLALSLCHSLTRNIGVLIEALIDSLVLASCPNKKLAVKEKVVRRYQVLHRFHTGSNFFNELTAHW